MPRKPWNGESAMEIGERLREYEVWAGLTPAVCWPDPEGDEQRQDPDYDKEGK